MRQIIDEKMRKNKTFYAFNKAMKEKKMQIETLPQMHQHNKLGVNLI